MRNSRIARACARVSVSPPYVDEGSRDQLVHSSCDIRPSQKRNIKSSRRRAVIKRIINGLEDISRAAASRNNDPPRILDPWLRMQISTEVDFFSSPSPDCLPTGPLSRIGSNSHPLVRDCMPGSQLMTHKRVTRLARAPNIPKLNSRINQFQFRACNRFRVLVFHPCPSFLPALAGLTAKLLVSSREREREIAR